jgi:hypothetical protein
MPADFQELRGLPAHGPAAKSFPVGWGNLGREGKVVEFLVAEGAWVGNFRPGIGGLDLARVCTGCERILVIARGDAWIVDPDKRSAEPLLPAVDQLLDVPHGGGWILCRQGLALARLVGTRLAWHTRRLSWDGIDRLRIEGDRIVGSAWNPFEQGWHDFSVDLQTGMSTGGSYASAADDSWEQLGS